MRRAFGTFCFAFVCAAAAGGASLPTMSEPIAYTVRFLAPQTHYADVEARFPTGGRAEIELAMAVWTPGSYLVREYARQVEGIGARQPDGGALAIEKTQKNRWRVLTRGAREVIVGYRVYCREMSVRTNFVDASFALLNGAATFLTEAEDGASSSSRTHEVELVPPPGWKVVVTPLPRIPGTPEGVYRFHAQSFDELVDSPLYAGNAAVHAFEVGGRTHELVTEGEQDEGSVWDGARAARDAQTVAQQLAAFWGLVPYPRYVIYNLLTESAGGLEHKDSTVLMASRFGARTRDGYLDWLTLVCHEMFHAWNGKRLRPIELGPFDYEHEAYTRSLWQVEGMTSYYDELLVHRAGLSNRKEYLKQLSRAIESVETGAGRKVQSLAAASFDAWIKFYRRDENFANSGVNYYTKGQIAAFLLDAEIRRATGGAKSLDDALHLLYARYSGERGFRTEELAATLSEVAGTDLAPFLHRLLDSTEDLPYQGALDWYGLRFKESPADDRKGKDEEDADADTEKPAEKPAWLGVETEVDGGRLLVSQVPRDTPAFAAGVNVGDEILAIGDYRVPPQGLDTRLKAYHPKEAATLLVARRERLLKLPIVFGEKPRPRTRLAVDPKATPAQKAHLEAWLTGKAAPKRAEVPGLNAPAAG